jgi:hypothetical protein
LNAAESARSAGEIERVYTYCQKIFAIAKNIEKPSKAAAAARRLMDDIEGFFANVPDMRFQNSERYPSKSVVMRGDTLAANQWQARR